MLAVSAIAQQDPDPPREETQGEEDIFDLSLDELVNLEVSTVSLFDTRTLDATSSITVVTEKEWREQGARRTFDALRYVPGVFNVQFLLGLTAPTFRGIASGTPYTGFAVQLDGFTLNTYSQGAGIYEAQNFHLGLLERVEVIRGPGSALYGSDAFYGVSSMRAWAPDEDRYEGSIEGGSNDFYNAHARVSHSLGESVRLTVGVGLIGQGNESVSYEYTDPSTLQLVKNDYARSYDSVSAFAKLSVDNGSIAVYFSDLEGTGWPSSGENSASAFPNGGQTDGTGKFTLVGGEYHWALGAKSDLELRAYGRQSDYIGKIAMLAGPVAPPHFVFESEDQRAGGTLIWRQQRDEDTAVQWALGYALDWMRTPFLSFYPTTTGRFSGKGSGLSRTVNSLFGEVGFDPWGDDLAFTLGGRFDYYSDFGGHFSPRAAVIWHPVETASVKLLYQHAFRAPSAIEQADIPGLIKGGGDNLDPESIDTYEAIFMHVGQNWSYDFTLFHSESEDGILVKTDLTLLPAFALSYQNVEGYRSQGIEFSGRYDFGRFGFFGGGSYVDSQLSSTPPETVTAFPSYILNWGMRFEDENTGMVAALYNLHFWDMSSTNTANASYTNTELANYWRTDLHLSWTARKPEWGDPQLFLNVQNLFDQKQYLPTPTSTEFGTPEPGTSVTVGMRVNF